VGGYEAAVAMAGTNVDLTPEATPGLHLMSLYAFERLRQLLAGRPEGKPRLTRREREVLAWSAQGKSAWESARFFPSANERSMSTPRPRCASSARQPHPSGRHRAASPIFLFETAASLHQLRKRSSVYARRAIK
jgi:hypothetical protein